MRPQLTIFVTFNNVVDETDEMEESMDITNTRRVPTYRKASRSRGIVRVPRTPAAKKTAAKTLAKTAAKKSGRPASSDSESESDGEIPTTTKESKSESDTDGSDTDGSDTDESDTEAGDAVGGNVAVGDGNVAVGDGADESPTYEVPNVKDKNQKTKKPVPIHFPKMDVYEDVAYLKKIPLDFFYKKEKKPGNENEEWLKAVHIKSKTKEDVRKKSDGRIVHIQKTDKKSFDRNAFDARSVLNFDQQKAEKKEGVTFAKNLYEEMIKNPDAFRMVDLELCDKNKIKNKIKKYTGVVDTEFEFFEIIRQTDDPAASEFTGEYALFDHF